MKEAPVEYQKLYKTLSKYQTDALKSVDVETMSSINVLKYGKALLSAYRKTRVYLRKDPDNPLWSDFRAEVFYVLNCLSKRIPNIVDDLLYSEEEVDIRPDKLDSFKIELFKFLNEVVATFYEEDERDKAACRIEQILDPTLDQTQLKALLALADG